MKQFLDSLFRTPLYWLAVFGLPVLGIALLFAVLMHVQETFSSEALIWSVFFLFASTLLLWVLVSIFRFRHELTALKTVARELRNEIAPEGGDESDPSGALSHFRNLFYRDGTPPKIQFYPRAFDLDSRYALERLPAVQQVGIQHIPALLTALGIFFTFVGLIVGIGEIDLQGSTDGLMEGMTTLLGGVGLAFYSSLAGICLSFLVLIATRVQISRADSITGEISQLAQRIESDRDQDPTTILRSMRKDTKGTENAVRRVLDVSEEQSTKMGQLASDIAEVLSGTLQDAIEESIGEPLVEMNEQLVSFQREGLDTHQKTLGNVLDAFLEEFQSSMGEQFSQLDSALEKTLSWHAETQEMLDELVDEIRAEREKQAELLDRREDFAEKRLGDQIEFHEMRFDKVRKLFEDSRDFHNERIENERQLHDDRIHQHRQLHVNQIEEQRSLLHDRRQFHDERTKHNRQVVNALEETAGDLSDATGSLSQTHSELASLTSTSLNLSEKLHNQLTEVIDTHQEQLESFQNTLSKMEKITEEMPQEYKAVISELHDELRTGLGETFEMFDQSTAEIVEHLSGSYVRMEGTLQKLSEEINRIPEINTVSKAQKNNTVSEENSTTPRHTSPVSE